MTSPSNTAVERNGLTRRDLLRIGASGAAAVSAYGLLAWAPRAEGSAVALELGITEGERDMVDGTTVYVRSFTPAAGDLSMPGPLLLVAEGDELTISLTNGLDEHHAFAVDGVVDSGPIPPGGDRVIRFSAPPAGTYLYHDPTDAPFNRLLGLHGALVTMPAGSSNRSHAGGPTFARQYVWVISEVDPQLGERARAGNLPDKLEEYVPRYFTINGQSGIDALADPTVTPHGRIGEPALIRLVNAGAATHAPHFHGNHVYVLAENGVALGLQMLKDTIRLPGGVTKDALLPFKAPPDAWPRVTSSAYPMHCHAEMSQTAAGGFYPQGLLAHWMLED